MRVLAHIIFEAASALRVGCGDADAVQDSPVQRDFNGLPMVLGSSLAGALRARFEAGVRARFWDKVCAELDGGANVLNSNLTDNLKKLDKLVQCEVERVFGMTAKNDKEKSRDSQVIFSNALMVLDAGGAVCEELRTFDDFSDFARALAHLPQRQHNRIGANGAVAEGGKFDEEVVFAGTRFKFSIEAALRDWAGDADVCESGAVNSNLSGGAGANSAQNDGAAARTKNADTGAKNSDDTGAKNGIICADFELLLAALQAGDFRLGASGTRGFGRIRVREIRYEIFGADGVAVAAGAKCRGTNATGDAQITSSLNAKLSRTFALGGAGRFGANAGANASVSGANSNLGGSVGANLSNSNLGANAAENAGDFTRYALRLTPENVFLFGSGYGDLKKDNDGLQADSAGVREALADYEKCALSERRLLVPASSVKGALAHRTMYYINAEIGNFIGADGKKDGEKNGAAENLDERARCIHETLFGGVKIVGANANEVPASREIGEKSALAAQKGRVLFGDFYFDKSAEKRSQVFAHNRIDRLTGGVADGALFAERAESAGEFELEIWVQSVAAARRSFVAQAWALAQRQFPEKDNENEQKKREIAQNRAKFMSEYDVEQHEEDYARAVRCFELAMGDVCGGWLALGAASAKGHGVFAGELSRGGEKLEVK